MNQRNKKRAISGALTLSMVLGSVTGLPVAAYADTTETTEITENAENTKNAENTSVKNDATANTNKNTNETDTNDNNTPSDEASISDKKSASDASGKEEVIYIMTDATGTVDSVNVVNIWGKGDVTDYGNYSNVKMLTSTDALTQSNDKITFSTNQDKVYYQGTMDNVEIPWKISVTYQLDGKDIAPADLAGKSGALKIHLKIDENTKCAHDYFSQYALQASLTLDTTQCENIVADDATLANVGADKQLNYTVLPGNALDAEITADVTDFEMDAIAINGIQMNLNIDIDDDELMDKVTEIMDASEELNDGATEVSDGTSELNTAGNSLDEGAQSLYEATTTLDEGMASLKSGMSTMQDGLNTLNAQSSTLTGGSAQMLEALKTIQTSLANVSMSTDELATLTSSSAAIKQGIDDLYNGAVALQTNFSYASYKAVMAQNGLDIDSLVAGNNATIAAFSEQIAGLQASIAQLKSLPESESNPEYAAQVATLEAQVSSLSNVTTLLAGNNAAISGTETYMNNVSAGAASLAAGLSDLKTNYEALDSAIQSLTSSLSDLAVNMSTLKSGIDELVTSYKALDDGINAYTDGVATIVASYAQMNNGASSLASGSKALSEGAGTLKEGTSALCEGIATLYDGTVQLNDGTKEFYEKTSDMDTQVSDSIDEMINFISGGDAEIISFASDKNTNVKSVQFVIKTAAIEKPDAPVEQDTTEQNTGFWQKLKDLF